MFGVFIFQGGISGVIVLWVPVKSTSASPMLVSILRPKGFMAFGISLRTWDEKLYGVLDLLDMTLI